MRWSSGPPWSSSPFRVTVAASSHRTNARSCASTTHLAKIAAGLGISVGTAHSYTTAVIDLLVARAPGLLKVLRKHESEYLLLDGTLAEQRLRGRRSGRLLVQASAPRRGRAGRDRSEPTDAVAPRLYRAGATTWPRPAPTRPGSGRRSQGDVPANSKFSSACISPASILSVSRCHKLTPELYPSCCDGIRVIQDD